MFDAQRVPSSDMWHYLRKFICEHSEEGTDQTGAQQSLRATKRLVETCLARQMTSETIYHHQKTRLYRLKPSPIGCISYDRAHENKPLGFR